MARANKEARVVAELGRPETAEETAARRAEDSRNYRARKTVNNLIYSLIAVLGLVVVIIFAVPRDDRPRDWQVDYRAVGTEAASSVPGTLITPNLPDTWQANRAELTRIGGHAAWVVNFITPSQEYITYEQIFDEDDTGLARLYGANRSLTNQRDIGPGYLWSEYDNRAGADSGQPATYALATFGLNDLFVLDGKGSTDEFDTLARAVVEQIGKVDP